MMAVSTVMARPYELRTLTSYALAAGPDATGALIGT